MYHLQLNSSTAASMPVRSENTALNVSNLADNSNEWEKLASQLDIVGRNLFKGIEKFGSEEYDSENRCRIFPSGSVSDKKPSHVIEIKELMKVRGFRQACWQYRKELEQAGLDQERFNELASHSVAGYKIETTIKYPSEICFYSKDNNFFEVRGTLSRIWHEVAIESGFNVTRGEPFDFDPGLKVWHFVHCSKDDTVIFRGPTIIDMKHWWDRRDNKNNNSRKFEMLSDHVDFYSVWDKDEESAVTSTYNMSANLEQELEKIDLEFSTRTCFLTKGILLNRGEKFNRENEQSASLIKKTEDIIIRKYKSEYNSPRIAKYAEKICFFSKATDTAETISSQGSSNHTVIMKK